MIEELTGKKEVTPDTLTSSVSEGKPVTEEKKSFIQVPPKVEIPFTKKTGFLGLPTWLWITVLVAAWAGVIVGLVLAVR